MDEVRTEHKIIQKKSLYSDRNRVGRSRVRVPVGEEVLCFFKTPKVALWSTCLHVQGTPGPVFPVLKRAERAADFLPLSSAEF
jgi:hypothetical protein